MDKPHIKFNDEELVRWVMAMESTSTTEGRIAVAKKIWEDGFRSAEAEVTYAYTGDTK